jgi:hypothetical protein
LLRRELRAARMHLLTRLKTMIPMEMSHVLARL